MLVIEEEVVECCKGESQSWLSSRGEEVKVASFLPTSGESQEMLLWKVNIQHFELCSSEYLGHASPQVPMKMHSAFVKRETYIESPAIADSL